MSKGEKDQNAAFQEDVSAENQDRELHTNTLNDEDVTKEEKKHLIINKETGKVIDARTGEEVTDIQVVTKDGLLGSISASGRIILCGANAYEKKYYFNPLFQKIPGSIQKELHIICVLFTQEAGGIFTVEFEDDGTVTMETNADADDITYDEVSAGLLIGEVRRQRQDLFEAMQMYYKIYILKENPADILAGEDEG